MSIVTFNKLLKNQGCVITVCTLMLVGIIAAAIYQAFAGAGQTRQEEAKPQAVAIAKVGDWVISEEDIKAAASGLMGGQGMDVDRLPDELKLHALAKGLDELLNEAFMVQLAHQKGIKLTDDDIIAALNKQLDDEIPKLKMQLITQGKLKPNATEQEFQEAVKAQFGKTLDEQRKGGIEEVRTALKDPGKRGRFEGKIASDTIIASLKKSYAMTDAEAKKNFDVYSFKRIYDSGPNGKSMMDKAMADIKGGLSFEKAMERYSTNQPLPKKKKSDEVTKLGYNLIQAEPELAPLLKLKIGEMSDVLTTREGAAIYKLQSIESKVPKDFEKNKQGYKDGFVTSRAGAEFQSEVTQAAKAGKVEWSSEAYKLLLDFSRSRANGGTFGPLTTPSGPPPSAEELLKRATDISKNGGPDTNLADQMRYFLIEDKFRTATPQERDKMAPERIEILSAFLNSVQDSDTTIATHASLRVDLADLYLSTHDATSALKSLQMAADTISGQFDAKALSIHELIIARVRKMTADKLVKDTEVADLNKQLDQWVKDKADKDKQDAEDAKARKIEADKQKAAEAKQKADAKKAAATKAPVSRKEFEAQQGKKKGN